MKALRIADSATVVLGLQDEIRRSEESRYDHRLHGVLLVAQGLTCPEVAGLLGDAPRSVEYWVGRFEEEGLAGLQEGERPGRPRRLNRKQLGEVDAVLRRMPREVGMSGNLWDGKTLAAWIERAGSPLRGTPVPETISTIGIPFNKSRVRWWRRRTRNDSKHIKKTPSSDGRSERGVVGERRGAFSATWVTLPDVDSAGDQGPVLLHHPTRRSVGYFGAVRFAMASSSSIARRTSSTGAPSSHSCKPLSR